MQDFVKEPVLGLLKSVEDLAPEELMHGMARGAGSLLNHSVGGVANSVSLITGRWEGKGERGWVSRKECRRVFRKTTDCCFFPVQDDGSAKND